jgi:hypothetical protein
MRTSLFAIILIFLCSCSNVPKPISYWVTSQQKMQAAHHWDVLAEDVAKDVKQALQKEGKKDPALLSKPIYLEPNKASLFGKVFETLLITQLFKQEIKLMESNPLESNSLKLEYGTQIVKHCSNRHTSPLYPGAILSLTALGHGVYKAFADNSDALGLFAAAGTAEVINDIEFEWGVPHHEIVITTKLTELTKPNGTELTNTEPANNDTVTIIYRKSSIYYIQDADFWHYANSWHNNRGEEKEMPIKKYTCVSE